MNFIVFFLSCFVLFFSLFGWLFVCLFMFWFWAQLLILPLSPLLQCNTVFLRIFSQWCQNTGNACNISDISASKCILKINNRNPRKSYETSSKLTSKLTIKTPARRHWCCSVVFILRFEYISHFFLLFLLITLNK